MTKYVEPQPVVLVDINGNPYKAASDAIRVAITGKPNGALAGFDTGQSVANFGNAPLTVSGGYWTHTPLSGPNSAGYGEVSVGGAVGRIGATFRFPSLADPNVTVTLVTPSTPWATDFLSNSACHFTVTPTTWNYSVWQNGVGQVPLISGTHALTANTDYSADVYFDGSTATILLPDGGLRQVTDSRITTWMGTTGIFEVYELDGTAATPAKISAARLDAARSGWAPGDGAALVARALNTAVQTTPPAASRNTGTFDTVLTGTAAEIGGGALRTTVKLPPSGKLLVTLACALELSAADNVLIQPRIIYPDATVSDGDAASLQQSAGYRQVVGQALYTGSTAGQVVTVMWMAFKVGSATATFHTGGANGGAVISALPVV